MILLLSLILDTVLLVLKIIRCSKTISLSVSNHASVSVHSNGQTDAQTAQVILHTNKICSDTTTKDRQPYTLALDRLVNSGGLEYDSFPVRIIVALRFLAMSTLVNSYAYYMLLGLMESIGNHSLSTLTCTITAKIFMVWIYLQPDRPERRNAPAYLFTILFSLCFHSNPVHGILCETVLLLYLLYLEHQGKPAEQEEIAPAPDQNSKLYLKTIEDSYRKNRALMHDLKNHIIALRSLAEQKEYDKLLEYTDSMAEKVSGNLFPVHSGNMVIDALLADKYHTAQRNQIFVEFLFIRCDANLDNGDLCTIIGNLFDNAITENLKAECTKDQWISISIHTTEEELIIELKNPLFHPLKVQNGLPATDKPNLEHHGIGLKNVRRVCDAYGGKLLWNDTDGIFTVSATLKL